MIIIMWRRRRQNKVLKKNKLTMKIKDNKFAIGKNDNDDDDDVSGAKGVHFFYFISIFSKIILKNHMIIYL
jgi:hypothetical protein